MGLRRGRPRFCQDDELLVLFLSRGSYVQH